MNNFPKYFFATAIAAITACPSAANIVINFDAVTNNKTVDGFYNGGIDGANVTGPNLGVDFTSVDLYAVSGLPTSSLPQYAISGSGGGSANVAAGFSSFDFKYGATANFLISVYSGFSGTGTLLGSTLAVANSPTDGFDPASVAFSGTAKSVIISGGSAQFYWDDLTFGTGAGAVPEPASWALMLVGFGAIGGVMRSKKPALGGEVF